jgi:protease-4
VRDFKLSPRLTDLTFIRTVASVAFDALGLSSIARRIEQTGVVGAVDRLNLNGMLALWQPAPSN